MSSNAANATNGVMFQQKKNLRLRQNFTRGPWFCNRNPDCSCNHLEDTQCESSQIWVGDKPNIPKPPAETEWLLIMRSDMSKMDACNVMPNGKRARCNRDVSRFLKENPAIYSGWVGYSSPRPRKIFSVNFLLYRPNKNIHSGPARGPASEINVLRGASASPPHLPSVVLQ